MANADSYAADAELDKVGNAEIIDFYSEKRHGGRSLLQYWDTAEAVGDSITPSIYLLEYRAAIISTITKLLYSCSPAQILSIGCGNGYIESELISSGHHVEAIDLVPEAVELARQRGVQATVADVRSWHPDSLMDLIYADGVLGHLYDPRSRHLPTLARIASWLKPAGYLVASCDSPIQAAVQEVPKIPNYWWLSDTFLRKEILRVNLKLTASDIYTYARPLSGERKRVIIVASRPPS